MRNAIIGATDSLEMRGDKGAVFENFFIAEKIKERAYSMRDTEIHFWRHRQSGEVDFIESAGQGREIIAYECTWQDTVRAPVAFTNAYPQAQFSSVNMSNILDQFGG